MCKTPHKNDRKEGLRTENKSILQQYTTKIYKKMWQKIPRNYQYNAEDKILTAII